MTAVLEQECSFERVAWMLWMQGMVSCITDVLEKHRSFEQVQGARLAASSRGRHRLLSLTFLTYHLSRLTPGLGRALPCPCFPPPMATPL